MSELIAVQGFTFKLSSTTASTLGTATVTGTPSAKVKAGGAGIYSGGISFSHSESKLISGTTFTQTAPVTGTIPATAVYTKESGSPVNRQGDSVTITVTGSDPQGATTTWTITVEVGNAGQTKAKAS
jgi:hypothetical protein